MLTDILIRNVKTSRKLYDQRGLYLLVSPQGGKWWRFKYRFAGKEKLLSLGTYPDVSLARARSCREDMRKLVAAGIDPSQKRKADKANLLKAQGREPDSLESVAREWFGKMTSAWAPSHGKEVIRRLERDVFPILGTKPIDEIGEPELLAMLRRIEARGVIETAHRINQICGQVFKYAIAAGKATRNPSISLRGALSRTPVKHHGALTKPADVAGLMRAIKTYQGSFVVKCALRFSLLTFQRPGEIRHAEWSEIDWNSLMWRIGASKMKMRREHLVPLARQAIEVLHELRPLTGNGRYIFPAIGRKLRPISENTILGALRRMGYERGEMTAHGFRTIASTLLNEHGWPADVIERQLAHRENDPVKDAYNRAEYLEQRRKMMQAWSDYLDKLAIPDEVTPFPSALTAY